VIQANAEVGKGSSLVHSGLTINVRPTLKHTTTLNLIDGSPRSMSFLSADLFPLRWEHTRGLAGPAAPVKWPELALPEPMFHFPVQTPHRVAADLFKLDGLPLAQDSLFSTYLMRKLALLEKRRDALLLPEIPLGADVWREIWQRLGLDQAALLQALGLAPQFISSSAGADIDQLAWAQQLTLAMQEDWVLISPQGRFEAGSVCFPSGWAPSEKFNLSLIEIHRPIADGEALRKASDALTRAMLQKGPFQRFVWTLARNSSLSRHPHHPGDLAAQDHQALYFRYERQTTLALPGSGRALFLIRVYVVPLEKVLSGELCAQRLLSLKASLSSMSEAVITYKCLGEIREQVLAMSPG
jgi:hypothetical protein